MGGSEVIVFLVMTDGRDELLDRTIASAEDRLNGDITRRVIHTDHSPEHVLALHKRYPHYEVIGGTRQGFGGAIARAWQYVAQASEEFVFATEDDFTYNRDIDLDAMADVMGKHRNIAQMALRRQPWNDDERRAGGVVELNPYDFTDRSWKGHDWLEQRLWWTTNPSMFRTARCARGWPTCERSEGIYSLEVFTDPYVVCGYWGARDSGEAIHHIGNERVGTGY